MSKMYECHVRVGSRDNRLFYWVKGARWVGDSIVVDLSPERCFIPQKLSSIATTLLCIAENRPRKSICVSCADVTSPEDLEDHPDLVAKYKAFIREYINTYGRDALLDILNHSEAAPSKEVSGND